MSLFSKKISPTEWSLLISNFIPVLGIVFFGWSVFLMLFLYWLETAVIGFFSLLRMSHASAPPPGKRGEASGIDLNAMSDDRYRRYAMIFFVFHFSVFMLAHLFVIFGVFSDSLEGTFFDFFTSEWLAIVGGIVPLFLSHTLSYRNRYLGDKEYERTDTTKEMMRPYGRVMLMHIVAFLGGFIGPLFLLLGKTVSDFVSHRIEHAIAKRL